MHTVSRVFTRLLFAVLCASAATLAIAAPALAVNVDLRIEGATETLHSGSFQTGPRSLATADAGCVSDSGSATATTATTLTAAADWSDAAGSPALFNFGGAFLCRLGGETGDGVGGYWLMKINNRTQSSPGVYLDGSTPLADGDKVLWYRDAAWPPTPTLDLVVPAKVGVGQALTGRVDQYDSGDDSLTTAAGAQVNGDGASAAAGADGIFTVAFTSTGRRLLTASKPGAIRSSVWVDVVAEPVSPAVPIVPLRPVNRFVRCGSLYGKGSPKHRRCIKVARAKQRAGCRKKAARTTSVCRKLAKRDR